MNIMQLFTGNMPDITPAQATAVVGWIVAQLVAYGLVNQGSEQRAISIGATALAAAWKLADAYLRGQRARAVAQSGQSLRTVTPPEPGA